MLRFEHYQCDESETNQNVLDGKKNICDGGTAMFVTEETMWEVGGSSFSVKPVLLMTVWIVTTLVPRPFPPPVFDRLQYANMEGEGLGDLVTCSYIR